MNGDADPQQSGRENEIKYHQTIIDGAMNGEINIYRNPLSQYVSIHRVYQPNMTMHEGEVHIRKNSGAEGEEKNRASTALVNGVLIQPADKEM